MASPSPSNQNQQAQGGGGGGGFDMNKLLKPSSSVGVGGTTPTTVAPNLTSSPSFPSLPSATNSPYLTPSSSYPPPSGPYPFHQHPHYIPYQISPQHQNRPPLSYPQAVPPSSPIPSSGSDLLMGFFSNQNQNQNPNQNQNQNPFPSPATVNAGAPGSNPRRLLSSKYPKGKRLTGNHSVHDIDVRLPGEAPSQLEVTPITKYISDPCLVFGRQIAVNRNYICYGLKLGAIRTLNIVTAMRALLRGHTQRVSDMAFFAEDVHLLASASVDGLIFIWRISEGPDEENNTQIVSKVVLALNFVGLGGSIHPRICWHPHKQEILMVAIGNCILRIDTIKAGKGKQFSVEEPLSCSMDQLIDGVQLFGRHDDQITELSMCQWMTTRLASASKDGTVKIWEDRKAAPLAIFRPHDGQPVNSVTFMSSPHRPDHIILITGGPLNRELKMWASSSEEGWLLPSDAESWKCTQTFELKSSAASKVEDVFFNQAVALPRSGLFLLANAKNNAVYVIHMDYGPNPAATRMDYIAEFTVTMPILSLTGTSEGLSGEHTVQIYCVQTQAIQAYALDLSLCVPPPLENTELDKTSSTTLCVSESGNFDGSPVALHQKTSASIVPSLSGNAETAPVVATVPGRVDSYSELTSSAEIITSAVDSKPRNLPSHGSTENVRTPMPPLPSSPSISRKSSGFKSPSKSSETSSYTDHDGEKSVIDIAETSKVDRQSSFDNVQKVDKNVAWDDITVIPEPPVVFKHPTHLVTPSEILSTTASALENSQITNVREAKFQDVAINEDGKSIEVKVNVVGETEGDQNRELDGSREPGDSIAEKRESSMYSQASDLRIQTERDFHAETSDVEGIKQANDISMIERPGEPLNISREEEEDVTGTIPTIAGELESSTAVPESSNPATKRKRNRGKKSQVSGPSSLSPSPHNSTDSSTEQGARSGVPSTDAALSQLLSMKDSLDQVMSTQKEMQKQMTAVVSATVIKEGKRLETSMGRSIERIVKANVDALGAHFLEENAKREKLERDNIHHITNLITNFTSKDLPALFERVLKKEIAAVGPAVARAITPTLEKCISSGITESFQKGVGDKAVNQLEKSVSSKLEGSMARHIQALFQTSGKQALQDTLRSAIEGSIIPAFEMSCKSMFEQVDLTFQKGLIQHTTATQQQFETSHSSLAVALRDAINSASSITQTLSGELADGQQKLLAMAAGAANFTAGNALVTQRSNGPLAGLHEKAAEAPVNPTTELSRLVAERKYEEAFAGALHRSDVSIVSWLCSQVDLQGIVSMVPLPLSQGVLLALLQQLACDIGNDTPRKLAWMREVSIAINPADPVIAVHVRPIFEQVYQILGHQRNLSSTPASEASTIRLLMHVINSLLTSCK